MSAATPAVPSPSPSMAAVDALRAAGERGDGEAVAELLAPDVVLHSPLTASVRFEGRAEVTALHCDIFAVLDDLRTAEPFVRGDLRAFAFSARVRGVELDAMMVLRIDAHERIAEITLYGRPLPAVATLFTALPPRVSARRRGPLMGALVTLLSRPLAFAVRTADRFVPHFV